MQACPLCPFSASETQLYQIIDLEKAIKPIYVNVWIHVYSWVVTGAVIYTYNLISFRTIYSPFILLHVCISTGWIWIYGSRNLVCIKVCPCLCYRLFLNCAHVLIDFRNTVYSVEDGGYMVGGFCFRVARGLPVIWCLRVSMTWFRRTDMTHASPSTMTKRSNMAYISKQRYIRLIGCV